MANNELLANFKQAKFIEEVFTYKAWNNYLYDHFYKPIFLKTSFSDKEIIRVVNHLLLIESYYRLEQKNKGNRCILRKLRICLFERKRSNKY